MEKIRSLINGVKKLKACISQIIKLHPIHILNEKRNQFKTSKRLTILSAKSLKSRRKYIGDVIQFFWGEHSK